jgi:hypothetical protein
MARYIEFPTADGGGGGRNRQSNRSHSMTVLLQRPGGLLASTPRTNVYFACITVVTDWLADNSV